jgi:ribulose-5-phosphate 4-epimerase/fuculose-1-phosphate aldolase
MKNRLDNINLKKLCDFFKILDLHKISDLTANHASIISSDNKSFYTNQHKYFFSEMKPSNLMKVNFFEKKKEILKKVNIAGYQLHRFLHMSKAKPFAILHSHSVNAVAISCLKLGFIEKLNQSSMRFYKKVKYVDYGSMAVTEKIGKQVARTVDEDTRLVILKNHGNIILAKSIEELQHLTFHFEKCCDIQLKVLNSGLKFNSVNNSIALHTSSQHTQFGPVGQISWNASIRKLKDKR